MNNVFRGSIWLFVIWFFSLYSEAADLEQLCKQEPYLCLPEMKVFAPKELQPSLYKNTFTLPYLEARSQCSPLSLEMIKGNFLKARDIYIQSYIKDRRRFSVSRKTVFVMDRFALMDESYCVSPLLKSNDFAIRESFEVSSGYIDFLSEQYFETAIANKKDIIINKYEILWEQLFLKQLEFSKCAVFQNRFTPNDNKVGIVKIPSACFSQKRMESIMQMPFDYLLWKDLNKKASRIWGSLRSCGTNEKIARIRLFTPREACEEQVLESYEKLKASLFDFAMNLLPKDFSYQEKLEDHFDRFVLLLKKVHKNNWKPLHSMHPLLEQALIDLLLREINLNESRQEQYRISFKSLDQTLALFSLLKLKPFEICSTYGLWPVQNQLLMHYVSLSFQNSIFALGGLSTRLNVSKPVTVSCHTRFLPQAFQDNWYEILSQHYKRVNGKD